MRHELSLTRAGLAEHAYPPATRRVMAGHSSSQYWANPANSGSVTVATKCKTYRILPDGSRRLVEKGKVHTQPIDDRMMADRKAQAANHVDTDSWAHKS